MYVCTPIFKMYLKQNLKFFKRVWTQIQALQIYDSFGGSQYLLVVFQKREAFANDLYLFLGILLAGNRDDVMKVHRRSNLLSEQFRTEVTQPPTHILSNNFFLLFLIVKYQHFFGCRHFGSCFTEITFYLMLTKFKFQKVDKNIISLFCTQFISSFE